jgi:glycosyltransferase involved in cell wall biosynthesis
MVLQEAMAMGAPSIGTDSGGVPEIITDEVTGLLVPPKDPTAIAEAILRLYRDPGLREKLSTAARAFVLDAYDMERQYAAFERALLDAIERRAAE